MTVPSVGFGHGRRATFCNHKLIWLLSIKIVAKERKVLLSYLTFFFLLTVTLLTPPLTLKDFSP